MKYKTCYDFPALEAGVDGSIRIAATGETLSPFVVQLTTGRCYLAVDFNHQRLPVAHLVVSAFSPDLIGWIGHRDEDITNCSLTNLGHWAIKPNTRNIWSARRTCKGHMPYVAIPAPKPQATPAEREPMVFSGGVPLQYMPGD